MNIFVENETFQIYPLYKEMHSELFLMEILRFKKKICLNLRSTNNCVLPYIETIDVEFYMLRRKGKS